MFIKIQNKINTIKLHKYVKKLIKMDYSDLEKYEIMFRCYPELLTDKDMNKKLNGETEMIIDECINILSDKLYLFKNYKKAYENIKNNKED